MDYINLDYAAASPVDPRVISEMSKHFREFIANPSSVHSAAGQAAELVEKARGQVAALINAQDPKHIIFTSGATEANNLALFGAARRNRKKGNKIVISAIEHMSVINPAKALAKEGFEIAHAGVDENGVVRLDQLAELIDDRTILVSVMVANNEIGTIEPVKEIAELAHKKGALFHADGTAALGKIPVDVQELGLDLLTISSNDLYGPQGAGALYAGPNARIAPIILGGGQERGLRSGTENLAGIVGMGKAAELARLEMPEDAERMKKLRDRLITGVLQSIPDSHLTGHPEKRLPNHASFRFDYVEGESIILMLDMKNILASTGSACTSKTLKSSHVLMALGLKHEEAHGSLVLTLGRWSRKEDVEALLQELPPILKRLREMSPLAGKTGG